MIHPVLGSEESWPILHWVLGGGGVSVCLTCLMEVTGAMIPASVGWTHGGLLVDSPGSWSPRTRILESRGSSYFGSWRVVVRPTLGPVDLWSILHWHWGVVVSPTHGPGVLWSVPHWVLGVHSLHPTLGPGGSWSILDWVLGSRGPTYTGSWGVVVLVALDPKQSWLIHP